MDSPWIMFGPPDKSREYFALLSCLPLNKYRAIPGFLRFSSQIQKQLRATPGVIGYSLRAKLLSRNFWTLSAWADEKALTDLVITHPGSVVVLPVLPDGRILLIQQYRHATRQYLWELVAGRMDHGETPKVAAARELIEETGYRAKRLRVFLDVFPTPGFLEERMFVLLAEGLTAGEAEPEEDEKIISRSYDRKQLEEMIRAGKLRDAKSIAGILFYFRFLSPQTRVRK